MKLPFLGEVDVVTAGGNPRIIINGFELPITNKFAETVQMPVDKDDGKEDTSLEKQEWFVESQKKKKVATLRLILDVDVTMQQYQDLLNHNPAIKQPERNVDLHL